MGRFALALLVVLALVPAGAGGAVATAPEGGEPLSESVAPAATSAQTDHPAYLDHRLSLEPSDETVTVRVTLREVDALRSLSVRLPDGAGVRDAGGFERRDGEWYWDGSPSTPTLTYELPVG